MMGGIRGNYCKGCDKRIADCTCESTRATAAPASDKHCDTCFKHYVHCDCAQPSPSTGGEPATDSAGRELTDAQILKIAAEQDYAEEDPRCMLRLASAFLAAREPAPVARELDVEAERQEFLAAEPNACWDTTRNRPAQEWANDRWIGWQASAACRVSQSTAESAPASAAPGELQQEITRLDVLSLIREHSHRCYVAGVDMLEIDPKYAQEIDDALKRLAPSNNSPVGAKESK